MESQYKQMLAPWQQVIHKADDFFARVQAEHGEKMRCGSGCTDCCHQDLSLLTVEALAVRVALDRLDRPLQARIARQGNSPCALLVDGLCAIYQDRPLICRTHGLPIRYAGSEGGQGPSLPVVCALNFVQGQPPKDAVLNGTLLLAGLTVADALVRKDLGLEESLRVSVSHLVQQGWSALPL